VSTIKIRDLWMWWRRKWFSGGKMVVVGFNQELPKFISRRTIRSKSDRDPGFVTWEEKGMAENGRRINKKGRNDW
jgi:hypothetical protein